MLGLVNNKFIIGKEEYYCIAAEMHYYRVHKRYWAICFERIKKAGFTMICSSVPWNLHERAIGQFDFAGVSGSQTDLIVFLELAREFGFKVILRCGPYIGAEWSNGGIPDFIFADTEILSRDKEGNPLKSESEAGVDSGFVPSYLHPKYLNHIKRYFSGLVESIQNYIYPKGPVFLMHIDEDISFRGNNRPFDGDYGDFALKTGYIGFLEKKYGSVESLNIAYNKKVRKFSEVEAPTKIEVKKPEEILRYLDWAEFKENTLSDYVNVVRERLESLGVGALFSTGVPHRSYFGAPANWKAISDHKVYVGLSLDKYENYPQISRHLRYLNSTSNFSWASRLFTGKPAGEPSVAEKYGGIENRSLKFQLTTALSSGIKGIVSYMFIERDHWYGSPLGEDGTVRESYDLISRLNEAIPRMKLENLYNLAQVGIAYDRSLLRYRYLDVDQPFPYINYLFDFCIPGLYRSFSRLNYDYDIIDTSTVSRFGELKVVFVPIAEFMPESMQTRLIEIIKEGANVVFIGLLPRYNEIMRPSHLLSKTLGITTKSDWSFGKVQMGQKSYDTQFFGAISKKNSAWRIFAKSGNKVIGASRKLGKGSCYVFTFDPGITYDPGKTDLLKKLFDNHKITTPVYSSDPDVDIIAHTDGARITTLYLINHAFRSDNDCPDNLRRVVIRVDPSIIKGSSGSRIKLVDLLGDEVIQTTVKELGEGLFVEIENMDSRVYLVEKR
jgi:hypothetical protein